MTHAKAADRLTVLASKHTAFPTMFDLLDAPGGYFPTLRCVTHPDPLVRRELLALADAYDLLQAARGDARRAFRA